MLDLSRLTDEQRQAVIAPDGPLLLLAGPGTGKTTVLAARIAYLVTVRELAPASILAITFTRAAARALRWRVAGMLGEPARALDIMTFHAFGWRVIRQWWQELGFSHERLLVYGREQAESTLRQATEQLGMDLRQQSLPELLQAVNRFRLTGGDVVNQDRIAPLALQFEDLLRRRNAVDFTAMLALPLRLLQREVAALRLYQDAYRAILLDEFQDVTDTEYDLARKLAEQHRNLTAAGDPAQCLYGWRGADVRLIERFQQDFPATRLWALTENFRSTGRLIAAANALGSHLEDQPWLQTQNPDGLAPVVYAAQDEQAEAAYVAQEIRRLVAAGQIASLSDVAVLYRTKQQALEITLALRARHIPFHIRGSVDLLARREVQDAVNYLRLADNPADGHALSRIVNVPPRRLGRLASQLLDQPVATSALVQVAAGLSPEVARAAQQLVELVEQLHGVRGRASPAQLLDAVMETSGYGAWLQRQPGGGERLRSLEALRSWLARLDEDLTDWLASVVSGEETDLAGAEADRISLATIHAAKGDEWPVVFIVGFEEALLPHYRAVADEPFSPGAVEEELRVAYVGLTRPRQRLYLSFCRVRQRDGQIEQREPSRFLRYLGPDVHTRARAA
ncbi:MAG: ATP-dependent helicase [Chloroflexota bacterium]